MTIVYVCQPPMQFFHWETSVMANTFQYPVQFSTLIKNLSKIIDNIKNKFMLLLSPLQPLIKDEQVSDTKHVLELDLDIFLYRYIIPTWRAHRQPMTRSTPWLNPNGEGSLKPLAQKNFRSMKSWKYSDGLNRWYPSISEC